MFKAGDRVKVTEEVDIYPTGIVPKGAVGTVHDIDQNTVIVKMDVFIPGFEEWDNEVYFYSGEAEEHNYACAPTTECLEVIR